jgi:hypothetical protein
MLCTRRRWSTTVAVIEPAGPEPTHDQHIEFLSAQPLQQIIQSRPADLRTALASIREDLVLPTPSFSELAEFSFLKANLLIGRRASRVLQPFS